MAGPKDTVRKVFDISPVAITSNGNFDGSGAPTTSWASGITGPVWLSNISESVADNGRVGISVALETFDIRVKINPGNTLQGTQHIRMVILADLQCDGSLPSIGDVLGDANNTTFNIAAGLEMAFLQPAYFGRFKIIEDKNWDIYCSSATNGVQDSSNNHNLYHEAHHDMRNHRLMWDTTDSSAIANARNGHLFMFFLFSMTTVATGGLPVVVTTNPPAIQYAVRLRFFDDGGP